ncbi:hypothetical protein TNCT_434271 [Trichonephila clavata]|uniref:Uncharacterized protein n=1 Tax=Trichonephila clavata TaxID=2740835 RepID=A0A8X6HZM4_TRICU|nr:hypothetical protein TNCT_434271 [Trichonephila clavata]
MVTYIPSIMRLHLIPLKPHTASNRCGASTSSSGNASCRKTRCLSESSQGGKMYEPSKLSPMILALTLAVNRCCVVHDWVLCELFKAQMCAMCILNTSC